MIFLEGSPWIRSARVAAVSSAPLETRLKGQAAQVQTAPVGGRPRGQAWWEAHPVVVPALLAMVAAAATWVATQHGPALSPDSVTYLSTARNLAAGHGYSDLTGQPNTTFAPGFPALLAIGQRVGLSLLTAARVVNAASFAGVVILAWALLRRHVASPRLVLAATGFVAISPALLNVADHAWSEPLFCVVLLGFILVLEDAVASTSHSTRTVALAGCVAGIGVLVRYAGVAFAITGVIVLLVSPAGRPGRDRSTRVGVFALAFLPLPALWLLRNASSGAPYVLGPRVGVSASLGTLLGLFARGVGALVVPDGTMPLWASTALQVAALVVIGAAVLRWRRLQAERASGASGLAPLVGFVVVYSVFVLAAGKLSGASIEARTIMPIYVPLVILAAWLIDNGRALPHRGRRRSRLLGRRVGRVLAVAFFVLYGVWFAQMAWSDGSVGHGYAAPSAMESPLARAVKHLPADALVATNGPWGLYYASGHQPIVPEPGPLVPAASLVPSTVRELLDAVCSGPVFVAWYGSPGSDAVADRFPALTLHPIKAVSDGTLYGLAAAEPCVTSGSSRATRHVDARSVRSEDRRVARA